MPFYKYYCKECDKIFEEFFKVEERKSTCNCPDCNTESNRDIKDFCSNFDVKCDGFFGKSK